VLSGQNVFLQVPFLKHVSLYVEEREAVFSVLPGVAIRRQLAKVVSVFERAPLDFTKSIFERCERFVSRSRLSGFVIDAQGNR